MKSLILSVTLLVAIPAAGQDSQMRPPSPEQMQKMMALMGPGPEHKTFETLVGTWMGTYYVTAAGKRAPGASQVVMEGEVDDMVLRWVDADTYVTEIIFHMPDGDLKIADMTFTRVK